MTKYHSLMLEGHFNLAQAVKTSNLAHYEAAIICFEQADQYRNGDLFDRDSMLKAARVLYQAAPLAGKDYSLYLVRALENCKKIIVGYHKPEQFQEARVLELKIEQEFLR
jgi:hypothetical protein